MLAAVTALNREISELAPMLNSPTEREAVALRSENSNVPIAAVAKRYAGSIYLFAVGMREGQTAAAFTLSGSQRDGTLEVLGENRTIIVTKGKFADNFGSWDVHLYRFKAETGR